MKIRRFILAASAIKDIIEEYYRDTRLGSDGGRKLTKTEQKNLAYACIEAIVYVVVGKETNKK
jgi:hypothetical protein